MMVEAQEKYGDLISFCFHHQSIFVIIINIININNITIVLPHKRVIWFHPQLSILLQLTKKVSYLQVEVFFSPEINCSNFREDNPWLICSNKKNIHGSMMPHWIMKLFIEPFNVYCWAHENAWSCFYFLLVFFWFIIHYQPEFLYQNYLSTQTRFNRWPSRFDVRLLVSTVASTIFGFSLSRCLAVQLNVAKTYPRISISIFGCLVVLVPTPTAIATTYYVQANNSRVKKLRRSTWNRLNWFTSQ